MNSRTFFVSIGFAVAANAATAAQDAQARRKVVEGYGKLPLAFEANGGQAPSQVKFLARGPGYEVFLTGEEAVLSLSKSAGGAGAALHMKLPGANPAAVTGEDALPGKSNYFIGNDPRKWLGNLPNYAKVRYRAVYPGVDLVYYGNPGQLEYDFVVAPGADPKAIRLDFSGARRIRVDRATGDLLLATAAGDVRFHKPFVYQGMEHTTAIDGRYILCGNRVRFALGTYDHSQPLIIDPYFQYSTTVGTSSTSAGIAVDASGNAYIAGFSTSSTFPTTPGAYTTTAPGGTDAFVTKIDPTGSTLVYSTYLGGTGTDAANGIAVDAFGDAFVAGSTTSADFPTSGGVQTTYGGGGDAFVAEINPGGSGLVYSTYLGGTGSDVAYGIALDGSGSAYVTGNTVSTDFPTQNPYQSANGGGCGTGVVPLCGDAFITKLSPDGSAMVYSTYLGGANGDVAYGIAVDTSGDAYITGFTWSQDFGTSFGCRACPLYSNGFVVQLNPAGSELIYDTVLGGEPGTQNGYLGDGFYAIALDASNNAYVTGQIALVVYPAAEFCPVMNTASGAANVWLASIRSDGVALSSYCFGGQSAFQPGDIGTSIAVAGNGIAYIGGYTSSSDFPSTPGAFQKGCAGCAGNYLMSPFVAAVYVDGGPVLYATALGSNLFEKPLSTGVALDASGNFYLTGTASSMFPTTPGAYKTGQGGGFLTKFSAGDQVWPLALGFGSLAVDSTSAPLTVTLANSAGTFANPPPLSISGIGFNGANSGDFAQANTCGTSLANGASCTISVTFHPSLNGSETATLTIADSAANSPQTVYLTGTGISEPQAILSATSLTFSSTDVGSSSAAQSATLSNTGNETLTIASIVSSGDYTQTNNCPSSLAAQSSCMINVTFTPTATGTRTGSIIITDNAPNTPQSISLTGAGVAPAVKLQPATLTFTSLQVGAVSASKQVTLTNSGTGPLYIGSVGISGTNPGDFPQTNTCPISPATLAVNATCTITVTFAPAAEGARSASISVTDNAAGSPQSVALSGTGLAPVVKLAPASIAFANQNLGTTSAARTVTVTNAGNETLTIAGIAIGGADPADFAEATSTCNSPVLSGKNCTISVTFSPKAAGARSAALNITDNAAGSPQSVTLTGTGTAPAVTLSPTSLTFAGQNVGTTSPGQTVTLNNTGTGSLTIGSIQVNGTNASEFGLTNYCGATLPAAKSCTFTVKFTPSATGARTAQVSISDNASGSPQAVSLTGTGTAPAVSLSPASLTFAAQTVGTTSPGQTVTLSNTGTGSLNIGSIQVAGTDASEFGLTNHCGTTLPAAKSCTFTVKFTPAATGTRTASVAIADNAAGSPQTVGLTGTGK